jgi:hypothetical protein
MTDDEKILVSLLSSCEPADEVFESVRLFEILTKMRPELHRNEALSTTAKSLVSARK